MSGGIKTGICSYGMSGKLFHAPFIQAHPGYELVAIVERHNQDSKERYPDAKLYRSVEELCADKELQLIVVNTPTYLHYEQAKMVLEAGKNMVIEKPFAVTTKEAEELTALAEKNKIFISVYQNRRYDGDFRAVKEVLQQGWLGEIREAEIRYDRYRPSYGGKPHKEGDMRGLVSYMISVRTWWIRRSSYSDSPKHYSLTWSKCGMMWPCLIILNCYFIMTVQGCG